MQQFNKEIEKYMESIKKILPEEREVINEKLLTNLIVTTKRLIIEIQSIEDSILKSQKRNQNILLILGAKFEMMCIEIKKIGEEYLEK